MTHRSSQRRGILCVWSVVTAPIEHLSVFVQWYVVKRTNWNSAVRSPILRIVWSVAWSYLLCSKWNGSSLFVARNQSDSTQHVVCFLQLFDRSILAQNDLFCPSRGSSKPGSSCVILCATADRARQLTWHAHIILYVFADCLRTVVSTCVYNLQEWWPWGFIAGRWQSRTEHACRHRSQLQWFAQEFQLTQDSK